jgi:hypothetical protein
VITPPELFKAAKAKRFLIFRGSREFSKDVSDFSFKVGWLEGRDVG